MARQEAIWKERKYVKRRIRIAGALTRSLDMFVVEHYPLRYRAVVMLDRRCEGTFIPSLRGSAHVLAGVRTTGLPL
jgi:hypothetical protein